MPELPLTPPDPPGRRSPFEWSLAGLRPADPDVARPSFMFKAGQASREKAVRFWQCVTAGLGVLFVVGGVAMFGVVSAEQQRAAAIVEHQQAIRVMPAPVQVIPLVPGTAPAPEPRPAESIPPLPRSATVVTNDPTPADIASALERRRNILVGGLGLIPDAPPAVPSEPRSAPSYPGVLAAPRVQKKPPVVPDPEPDHVPDIPR
jgi:hypothetical protein